MTQTGQQVSTGGGRAARWSRSSKELFFVGSDGALMRVAVEAGGPAWQAGTPTQLFDPRYFRSVSPYNRYDVSPDDRLLIIKPADSNASPPKVIVVQHWDQELTRLAPPK